MTMMMVSGDTNDNSKFAFSRMDFLIIIIAGPTAVETNQAGTPSYSPIIVITCTQIMILMIK